MALNNMGLGFVFTAKDLASGTMNRLQGNLTGLGATSTTTARVMKVGFATMAGGIASLVAGLGTLGTAFAFANKSAEFQRGLKRVGNIAGATAGEMEQLRDKAVEAGLRTQFSPDESVEGLANLAAMGFNTAESMDLLDQSLNLAAGGQIEIAEAAKAAASAVRVFSLNGEEQAQTADKLLKITTLTSLQAGDLSLALSRVSRGAGATKQSLDEMLVSIGLVRNTGAEASVASNSVSRALLSMGDKADKFDELGVKVTDSSGKFRDFLDVVLDTKVELDNISNDAERAAKTQELFGKFGLTAFNGISNQIETMFKKRDDINTMSEAIEVFRKEMGNAKGTAEELASALLDTFAGQKLILSGVADTLAVVLGTPFAKVFKPVVTAVVDTLLTFAKIFMSLPDSVQTAGAAIVVATGAFFTFAGVLGIIAGLLAVISPFLVLGIKIFLGLAAAMLPVFVATAALAAAFAGLWFAVKNNLGGIGDFFTKVFDKIKLAFNALKQVFSQGGFSGAVREELNKAENQGLKSFVLNVFSFVKKLEKIWLGLKAGFTSTIEGLSPVFEDMKDAFGELGEALGLIAGKGAKAGNSLPTEKFVSTGAKIGSFLAKIIGGVAKAITMVTDFVAGFVKGIGVVIDVMGPVFKSTKEAFSELFSAFSEFFSAFGMKADEGGSAIQFFGQAVGQTLGSVAGFFAAGIRDAARFITFLVNGATLIKNVFDTIGVFVGRLAVRVQEMWGNMVDGIRNAIDRLLVFISGIVSKIPSQFRPDALNTVVQAAEGAEARIANRNRQIQVRSQAADQTIASSRTPFEAEAEGRAQSGEGKAIATALEASNRQQEAERAAFLKKVQGGEGTVILKVDGETLGKVVRKGERDSDAKGFVPVPTESG